MERQILLRWGKRILLALMLIILGLVIALGIRTKSHIDTFTQDLKSGASLSEFSKSAGKLSKDIDLFLKIAKLPIVKQSLNRADLNLTQIKDEISAAVKVAPFLVGVDRPKQYMIAFQNSAEARGTGGIIGAFAIVELSKGKITVIQSGSNVGLKWIDEIPIKMPDEFKSLYRSDPAIWVNSNLSPHFPYGAEIWLALWKKQFGQNLDGVIAVDPSALSYMLKATGPITLPSGKILTSDNLVSETLSAAYKVYENDNMARKKHLVTIIDATFKKLLAGGFDKLRMAHALQQGILENRLLIYSKDAQVAKALKKTRLSGFMDTTLNNEFRAVVQNIDASKLDYYLDRATSVRSLGCGAAGTVEVSVTVKNSLKTGEGLPAYVLTRADKSKPASVVAGQHRFKLFIYGPPRSSLIHATRSSTFRSAGGMAIERERPVFVADIDLEPGASEQVTAVFSRGVGKLGYYSQPLVRKERVKVYDQCK
jgi:hypothetical protein